MDRQGRDVPQRDNATVFADAFRDRCVRLRKLGQRRTDDLELSLDCSASHRVASVVGDYSLQSVNSASNSNAR